MSAGIKIDKIFFPYKAITSFSLPSAQRKMVITQGKRKTWIQYKSSDKAQEVVNTLLNSTTEGRLEGTYKFKAFLVKTITHHPDLHYGGMEVTFGSPEERDQFFRYASKFFFPRHSSEGGELWEDPVFNGPCSLFFKTFMFYPRKLLIEKLLEQITAFEPYFKHFIVEQSPYAFL